MTHRLKRGDQVQIRLAGSSDEWTRGIVVVASDAQPSSVSLMVEGMVRSNTGGWIGGGLPLIVDYEKQTVESLLGDLYDVEVASLQATYAEPEDGQ